MAVESLIKSTATPTPVREPVRVMEAIGDSGSRGTVITNQKRGRFRLLPSIVQAIIEWYDDTKRGFQKRAEKKRLAIPTVRTIEERKETIKKAATVSAISPKDDYAKLAAKLPPKTQPNLAIKQPVVTIAKKEAVPAPSWGHFENETTGPETPTASVPPAEPKATVVQVPVVPTPPPPPIAVPVAPEPKIIVPPVETQPPIPMPAEPIPPPPLSTPAPIAQPEPIKPVAKPVMPVATEPVTVGIGRRQTPVTAPKKTPPARRNFRWLFYVGVVTTAIVATVGGASLVTWLLGDGSSDNTPVVSNDLPTTYVTPVPQTSISRIVLPRTRLDWYSRVAEVEANDLVTIVPINNIGGAESLASSADVLAALALRVEPALIRSIKEITFLKSDGKLAIILKVTSYDSSFGGLLLSEKLLSSELAPLFGPVVTATYKVGVGTGAPEFIDELADNRDVRVLKDEMETERLVYGFIDQNTIVIAPDKETFSSIAARLR